MFLLHALLFVFFSYFCSGVGFSLRLWHSLEISFNFSCVFMCLIPNVYLHSGSGIHLNSLRELNNALCYSNYFKIFLIHSKNYYGLSFLGIVFLALLYGLKSEEVHIYYLTNYSFYPPFSFSLSLNSLVNFTFTLLSITINKIQPSSVFKSNANEI